MVHTPHPATCSCAEHQPSRCRLGRGAGPKRQRRGSGTTWQHGGSSRCPPAVTQKREGRKGGARTRRVHGAGTVLYIFVKAFARQSFRRIFILWGFIFLVLRISAFSWRFNPRSAASGARALHATPAPMQHPTLPRRGAGWLRPAAAGGGRKGGREGGQAGPFPPAPPTATSPRSGQRARVREAAPHGWGMRQPALDRVIEEKEEREEDTP